MSGHRGHSVSPLIVDPQCLTCKHFFDDHGKGEAKCEAFPDGIPDEIFLNAFDHKLAYPGDGGIQYEEGPTIQGSEAESEESESEADSD